MNIEVVKIGGEWKVEFSFGVQSFLLSYGGTNTEAKWMASMLKKCFANYEKSLKTNPL